ncbi:hypothetical protein WJ542_03185 [Paraburkholderia sp. B3]
MEHSNSLREADLFDSIFSVSEADLHGPIWRPRAEVLALLDSLG